jgi:hypothetical protein
MIRVARGRFAHPLRAALTCSAAIGSFAVPGMALAQDAAAEDESADGNEIVVTATKREQTLAGRAGRRQRDHCGHDRTRADPRSQGPVIGGALAARGRTAEFGQHQFLHPRLRQWRQQRRHRAFGRRVRRWRLPFALGRADRRPARCAARRSSARAAVDPVRQERICGRDLDRHRSRSSNSAAMSRRPTATTTRWCSRAWSPGRCPIQLAVSLGGGYNGARRLYAQ